MATKLIPRDQEEDESCFSGFEYLASDTNNSMPLADKQYDPPEIPEMTEAYTCDLGEAARTYRETHRLMRHNYVTVFLRIRRRNSEQLIRQLLTAGILTKENMYKPMYLPFWTIGIRLRVTRNYPMGRVMNAMKSRLGITNPGLKFCLDGFFGMRDYSDVLGNTVDACPWMEFSNFSTADSLRLQDGDNIFISIATVGQIESVLKWRKSRSTEQVKTAPTASKPVPIEGDSSESQGVRG